MIVIEPQRLMDFLKNKFGNYVSLWLNFKKMEKLKFILLLLFISIFVKGAEIDFVWTSPSKNSSESMPCGGGDIGMNVWVENGDVLFYMARSGAFDENNTLLKQGRFRVSLTPNPFINASDFRQTLKLNDGNLVISSNDTKILFWVDVFKPVVHVEIESKKPISTEIRYENWRYTDRIIRKGEGQQNSYKWAVPQDLKMKKDSITANVNSVTFYHRNPKETIFDVTVLQQGLNDIKNELYNPLKNLTSGGKMWSKNLFYKGTEKGIYAGTDFQAWIFKSKKPAKSQELSIALEISQTENIDAWQNSLSKTISSIDKKTDKKKSIAWWNEFWNRSYIQIDGKAANLSRNYTLFRYMLGCNAKGNWPTRFNGGLFTFDPVFVDSAAKFTPDYRKWGGGTFTAQNQRLVYWTMLKSGDFDLMLPKFDFYNRLLTTAELRSKVYWGHAGACFTEQMENFGLPNPSEYGWKRPEYFDKGVEYNAWLEYQWETALEFCMMILETKEYAGADISKYEPLIESVLTFFDEHYRYRARLRGRREFDGDGKLIVYPASACETYKMATNPVNTTAGLRAILERIGTRDSMLKTIPPLYFRNIDEKKMISPAKNWERINNTEVPQLYPVFPWRMFGVGRDSLEIAANTYLFDPDVVKFRSHIGWKQDNIFAACLGLTDEAVRLNSLKLSNGTHRFPAFWGPGFDWTPDHNWGGSGMIGLQEMLLQNTDDGKILLFPAWPSNWDVRFKLHAHKNTIVEAELKNGEVSFKVTPDYRKKDIVIFIEK